MDGKHIGQTIAYWQTNWPTVQKVSALDFILFYTVHNWNKNKQIHTPTHFCVCVCPLQVYLWYSEGQAQDPGHPSAAVPESCRPDPGS